MFRSDEGLQNEKDGKPRGWSVADTLLTGNVDKKVSLQADFEDAGPFTVQFSLSTVDTFDANSAIPRAEAIIELSIAGNTTQRVISITNGVSISGVAEAVRVICYDVTVAHGTGTDLNKSYQVIATVGPGTRPAGDPPLLLRQIVETTIGGDGGTDFANIPQNVGVRSVMVNISSVDSLIIPDNQVTIKQEDSAANVICSIDPRNVIWWPIAPGAQVLYITNNSTDLINYSIFWGIDG